MKRKTYLMPLVEQAEVLVEAGIAVSDFAAMDNIILDMEVGSEWGALE
ncbi:MAG: hypothetical protein IIV29_06165 [Tidjanibacter sp.]|jgi:hypothetical protein|nr:hypothetical protein [Tidjanibacter sp.]